MCSNENNFQVATTHHLFTFDIRKCSGNATQLTRTTHQFKTPPLIMDTLTESRSRTSTETFLAMTGSQADDLALCRMTRNHVVCTVERTPLRKIHTVNSAYEKLRERGLLHNTRMESTNSKDRAKRVTTGLRIYGRDSELYLLSQNCYGELFYQNISAHALDSYKEPEFTERHQKEWRKWLVNSSDKSTPRPMAATTVTNFNSIQTIFKYNMPLANEEDSLDDKKVYIPKWRRTIEQLSNYKDILAADLFALWNIRTLKSDDEKTDPKELVESWLCTALPSNRTVFSPDKPNKPTTLVDGFR